MDYNTTFSLFLLFICTTYFSMIVHDVPKVSHNTFRICTPYIVHTTYHHNKVVWYQLLYLLISWPLVPTLQFLRSFSMYVLVDFYSRHFVGTRPQTMVSAACPSPNDPLGNGSVPRYFRGTFHLCMGTMPMLFT